MGMFNMSRDQKKAGGCHRQRGEQDPMAPIGRQRGAVADRRAAGSPGNEKGGKKLNDDKLLARKRAFYLKGKKSTASYKGSEAKKNFKSKIKRRE